MNDPGTPQDVYRNLRKTVPLTEEDSEQLHHLLQGVKASADHMDWLAPVFPDEVDPARFSTTVDPAEENRQ